jgi:hypothetical protein
MKKAANEPLEQANSGAVTAAPKGLSWNQRNPERIRAARQRWNRAHKAYHKARSRRLYPKRIAYFRAYYQRNKARLAALQSARSKKGIKFRQARIEYERIIAASKAFSLPQTKRQMHTDLEATVRHFIGPVHWLPPQRKRRVDKLRPNPHRQLKQTFGLWWRYPQNLKPVLLTLSEKNPRILRKGGDPLSAKPTSPS